MQTPSNHKNQKNQSASAAGSMLFIASDHAGFELKQYLVSQASKIGRLGGWIDLGPETADRVDYPDFADRLVKEVIKTKSFGVLICGSGQGMAIRANRYPQIRAALCWNEDVARLSREHNDANVLCLGSRFTAPDDALKIVSAFLSAEFEGGRHQARVEKLSRKSD